MLFWSVYLEPSRLWATEAEQLRLCVEAPLKWKCSVVWDSFQTASFPLGFRVYLYVLTLHLNLELRELGEWQLSVLLLFISINVATVNELSISISFSKNVTAVAVKSSCTQTLITQFREVTQCYVVFSTKCYSTCPQRVNISSQSSEFHFTRPQPTCTPLQISIS